MRRVGLVCALRIERDCLAAPDGPELLPGESGPFETSTAALGYTEAVCAVSGIGKGAAAAATQYLVDRFSPVLVMSFGLAGALEGSARAGDIVLPAAVLQGDTGVYDRRGFQHPRVWAESEYRRRFHHEFLSDPDVHEWGLRFLRERGIEPLTGLLVTCDQAAFSSSRRSELRRSFQAVAVDMESAVVAQVAALNNVPFAALRAVSDARDLEMEDASSLAAGNLTAASDPRHRGFIREMKKGTARALGRLGEILPGFVEGCPSRS